MQEDFHYYATYAAAILAGYTHKESMDIAYSAQFVDLCSVTLLSKIKAPLKAATTQLQLEMMDARTDIVGLQNITRIWASFHFLPKDLYAQKVSRSHPLRLWGSYRKPDKYPQILCAVLSDRDTRFFRSRGSLKSQRSQAAGRTILEVQTHTRNGGPAYGHRLHHVH